MASNSKPYIYSFPELDLSIYNIVEGQHLDQLDALLELYCQFFPSYIRYVPIMQRRARAAMDPHASEYQWLVKIGDQPAAMTVFKYIPARDCGVGLDLAVAPQYKAIHYQGFSRLSQFILDLRIEQIKADAQKAGRPIPIGMLTEMESPKLFTHYRQYYGYIELPVEYYEPPMVARHAHFFEADILQQTDFQRMNLGIYPFEGGGFDLSDSAMIASLVQALLVDHYGLPTDHWVVRRALESIP